MASKDYEEFEDLQITITLEDDSTVDCDVLTRFPLNGQQYIAIAPVEGSGYEDDIYLYRFAEDADGEPLLTVIEDDEEYDAVADRFDEILDEAEYDEWVNGDEKDD